MTNTTQQVITAGSYVTLHYRIGLMGGGDLVSTFGDRPATLMMGTGQFSPVMEEALIGMSVGEHRVIQLESGVAYGVHNPELVRPLSIKTLRENSSPEEDYVVGDMIEFNGPGGSVYSGVLLSIDNEVAVFDFNHPLAGKAIELEAQIIGVL